MQTFTTCMRCQIDDGVPNLSSMGLADISESGVVEVTCDRGHHTAMVLQQTKFEILAELGVKAIVNSSFREAVSSFAASLERLHEFFIEATCRKNGISPEKFASSWKHMANQSERQLGAFIAIFLLDNGEPPKLLPQRQVELRNAVVHKGLLPTREQAVRFGQAVFDCALPVLLMLRSASYAETIHALTLELIDGRSKQAWDAGLQTSTICLPTPLSFAMADQPTDFEAIISSYADRPDLRPAIEESHKLGALINRIRNAASDREIPHRSGDDPKNLHPPGSPQEPA